MHSLDTVAHTASWSPSPVYTLQANSCKQCRLWEWLACNDPEQYTARTSVEGVPNHWLSCIIRLHKVCWWSVGQSICGHGVPKVAVLALHGPVLGVAVCLGSPDEVWIILVKDQVVEELQAQSAPCDAYVCRSNYKHGHRPPIGAPSGWQADLACAFVWVQS